MLLDYHTHTNTSTDAKGSVEENCKKAVEIGLKEICFTNHQEGIQLLNNNEAESLTKQKMVKYIQDIEKAKEKFSNLSIKFGVEIGYDGKAAILLNQFISNYDFDYVLSSIHDIDGKYVPKKIIELNSKKEQTKFIKEYFRLINCMINEISFDCVGHIDVIFKFLSKTENKIDFIEYKKDLIKCIDSMKKKDVGFELNTRGLNLPIKNFYPSKSILRLFFNAGIQKITIGSDSHSPDQLGFGIKQGIRFLKDVGFTKFCTFEKRKPTFYRI
jgi:histidinol-phosphatase (PHP family)